MTSININFIITNVRPPEYLIYLISLLVFLSLSLPQLQLVLKLRLWLSSSVSDGPSGPSGPSPWQNIMMVKCDTPLYYTGCWVEEHEDTPLLFPSTWIRLLFSERTQMGSDTSPSPSLQHFSKWRIWYLIVVWLTRPRAEASQGWSQTQTVSGKPVMWWMVVGGN